MTASSESTSSFVAHDPSPQRMPLDPTIPHHLGSVPYLNAKPLTYAINEPIVLMEPKRLSLELQANLLHAALVPLAEVLENFESYHIVDGIAIGSLNSVYSVVMAHTMAIVRMKTIALDTASKTSNLLIRVLLEKYYRLKPSYVRSDDPADGQVMIGDPAIAYRRTHPDERYLDLSQSWHSHTGLPFVFAVWAVRKDAPNVAGLAKNLRAAAKVGLAMRDQIAKTHFEYRYLTEHLYYNLNGPQKKAIAAFASDLVEIGQLANKPVLSYI
jgi:predicted solute-binding protein